MKGTSGVEVMVGVGGIELQHHRRGSRQRDVGSGQSRVGGSEGLKAEDLFEKVIGGGSVGGVIGHEVVGLGRVTSELGKRVEDAERENLST